MTSIFFFFSKLYQKTHIPAVAVLTTISEEDETFGETDKQQTDSHTSCLTDQQGVLNGSLCNLFDPSAENDEASDESQQVNTFFLIFPITTNLIRLN